MGKFQGILGIGILLFIAYVISEDRKKINWRLILIALTFQFIIGAIILGFPIISDLFGKFGNAMKHIEYFAMQGASFVFGGILTESNNGDYLPYGKTGTFIFGFTVTATIILMSILITVMYHFGLMQKVISWIAKWMNNILKTGGVEVVSNVSSAIVGQIEAQILIGPYLKKMTRAELFSSMSGSMACIAGGVMVVYIGMGANPVYLIAASLMSIPGAIAVSNLMIPQRSTNAGNNIVIGENLRRHGIFDAISHGAEQGMKISISVIAVLIGFIALVAFVNAGINYFFPSHQLSELFGYVLAPFAWLIGVTTNEVVGAGQLMGEKLVMNEFVAFRHYTQNFEVFSLHAQRIISFAICGFANFGSVGMQISGISVMVPERRDEISSLALKALLAGTLTNYISAAMTGLMG